MSFEIHVPSLLTEQQLQQITEAVQAAFSRQSVVWHRDDTRPVLSPELHDPDRAIYHHACQHIADVARFTGNVSRIRDPAMRRKTAELLRDAFTQLALDMKAEIVAAERR